VDTGSWMLRPLQGRGLGTEARAAVLAFAFEGLDARYARTGARDDNAASLAVTRRLGYELNGEGELCPQGTPVRELRFRVDRAGWERARTIDVQIEGLDPCRALFGA
jgi:RimJ/RimL family protein N-acetyltransferase